MTLANKLLGEKLDIMIENMYTVVVKNSMPFHGMCDTF